MMTLVERKVRPKLMSAVMAQSVIEQQHILDPMQSHSLPDPHDFVRAY